MPHLGYTYDTAGGGLYGHTAPPQPAPWTPPVRYPTVSGSPTPGQGIPTGPAAPSSALAPWSPRPVAGPTAPSNGGLEALLEGMLSGMSIGGGYGLLNPAIQAGQLNLSNVRGGMADWMSLALAPFMADMQRQQAASSVASLMGFFPNDFSRYGIPQAPEFSPPDWINQWLQSGVPPGSGPGGGGGGFGGGTPAPPTGGGGFAPGSYVAQTADGWEVVIGGTQVGVFPDQGEAEREFNRRMGV